MPIFEYNCTDCENIFEEFVMSSKVGDVQCPKCKGVNTHKLFSTFASKEAGSVASFSSPAASSPFT